MGVTARQPVGDLDPDCPLDEWCSRSRISADTLAAYRRPLRQHREYLEQHPDEPPQRDTAGASSRTVDSDFKGFADLAHTGVCQPAQTFDEYRDRDTLKRVQVDCRPPRDRIVAEFEDDLAGKASNRRRARCDECPTQPWDRRVAREHDDRAPTDLNQFAPPHLPTDRKRAHEAAAACRNDARSPHSSGSSAGCSSYAA